MQALVLGLASLPFLADATGCTRKYYCEYDHHREMPALSPKFNWRCSIVPISLRAR